MNSPARPATHERSLDEPVARIDAQEESYVAPIREFLETWGCQVVVNRRPTKPPLYHIICGDEIFVKKILEDSSAGSGKRLAVLWNGTGQDASDIARKAEIKVVYGAPKNLDSRAVESLFAFFFSDKNLVSPLEHDQSQRIFGQPREARGHLEDGSENDRKRIEESIRDIFHSDTDSSQRSDGKASREKGRRDGLHRPEKRKFFPVATPWRVAGILAAAILLSVAWYLTSITLSAASLSYGLRFLRSGSLSSGVAATRVSEFFSRQAKGVLTLWRMPLGVIGQQDRLRGQERLTSFFDDVVTLERGLSNMATSAKHTTSLLFSSPSAGQTEEPAIAVDTLRSDLTLVQTKLQLAQSQFKVLLDTRTFPFSVRRLKALGEQKYAELLGFHRSLTAVDNVLVLYPEIAGFKEKKTYLVLFQNSMELRPTGGFIGSIASTTFFEGRLSNLTIQDVYTVDGQLRGHVDPPLPIRELLRQEHWYLRDSNWDPDFSRSGPQAAWFYEKETGVTVDGVIAINVPLVIDLLRETGPLDLPDYNDRITADNFFGKSLYYTHTDFFPGSTQKKDFLGSLTGAILERVTSGKGFATGSLLSVISRALTRGDLLVWFRNPTQQAIVTRMEWAGSIPRRTECLSPVPPPCFADTISVIEANMGVNKVNYFISRTQKNQIVFRPDGSIAGTITITFRNSSGSDYPGAGGLYRTYVRLYLPPDGSIGQVMVDGALVRRRDRKRQPEPVLPYMEDDEVSPSGSVVGVALEVPAGSQKELSISYERGALLQFGKDGAPYELRIQKQPGVENVTFQTSILYPQFWSVRDLTGEGLPTLLAKQARLEYNTAVPRDQIIELTFVR